MEHVTRIKSESHVKYQKNMIRRIKELRDKADVVIQKVIKMEGDSWNHARLLEEWERKRADHLNNKDCK
jgi:hypothetical protein